MCKFGDRKGFSLIEILIALGVLAMGMLFAGGTFTAAMHFSKVSTERTIGAIVADEAFAKIRLYSLADSNGVGGINFNILNDPRYPCGVNFAYAFNADPTPDPSKREISDDEFAYPSASIASSDENKQYYWSAVCRLLDLKTRLVQVTVFVSRKTNANHQYPFYMVIDDQAPPMTTTSLIYTSVPRAVPVQVKVRPSSYELEIEPLLPLGVDTKSFIDDGSKILDVWTGEIYRVLERYKNMDDVILFENTTEQLPFVRPTLGAAWVVPPAVNGSSNPCIGVYQKVMRF